MWASCLIALPRHAHWAWTMSCMQVAGSDYLEAGCGLDRPSGPGSSCLAKHTSSPGFCTSTSSTAFRGAGGGGGGCAAATGAMGGCTTPLLEMAGMPAQQLACVRPNIISTQCDFPGRQNLHTASVLTPGLPACLGTTKLAAGEAHA